MAGITIKKRYSRHGMLTVINAGLQKRGFWICSYCGAGGTFISGMPKTHDTPWGDKCKGTPWQKFLGHEFQSDVLELRFTGGLAEKGAQGFWLSLTAALLVGASKALDIERDDIDGTVLGYGGSSYRAVVLFDSVPGGAGHVKRISDHLQKVFAAALEISDNCTGCSRDLSCNLCLRNYRNQYAHDLLERGIVADFIKKIMAGLYKNDPEGFMPIGRTDPLQWLLQEIERSKRLYLIASNSAKDEDDSFILDTFYKVIHDLAAKEIPVCIFVEGNFRIINELPFNIKVGLQKLTSLTHFQNMEIYIVNKGLLDNIPPMYFETESNSNVVKCPCGVDPFNNYTEILLSTSSEYTKRIKQMFEELRKSSAAESWDLLEYEKLVQGTKIIRLIEGERKNWEDLIGMYLPQPITKVEIYDRYIRNRYQFKSLSMFLDAVIRKKSNEGIVTVEVTTTSDDHDVVKGKFQQLQEQYSPKGLKLRYNILEPSNNMKHYRRIIVSSNNKTISLWLDRGLDIYRFSDMDRMKYETVDSYVVVEE